MSKRRENGGLYVFVLKLLLSACSHKETERASGKERGRKGEMNEQGWSERKRGTGGGDIIAAAHKEAKGQ